MSESEWKTIPYKKHRKSSSCINKYQEGREDKTQNCKKVEFYVEKISILIAELVDTKFCDQFLAKFIEILNKRDDMKVRQVVCYGLGSPTASLLSSYQLAMLIIINKMLSSDNFTKDNFKTNLSGLKEEITKSVTCSAYDPIFSNRDKEILQKFNVEVLEIDESGFRQIDESTLFYMIHCDKWLSNNILWKNWCSERLSNIVIIGNSFKSICERTPTRHLRTQYKYLHLAEEFEIYVEELLPVWGDRDDVFNDSAIIYFPSKRCNKLKEQLISSFDSTKPTYSD